MFIIIIIDSSTLHSIEYWVCSREVQGIAARVQSHGPVYVHYEMYVCTVHLVIQ